MKKIFNLATRVMNGTVTIKTHIDSFSTLELAEKAKEAVIKANENNDGIFKFSVFCDIQESTLFENKEEIPILNGDGK